ncbi:hypothetical protein Q9233_017389 [Columba guinea]|nr:hypothetical protein Q9233_017389 [Columba guinea]
MNNCQKKDVLTSVSGVLPDLEARFLSDESEGTHLSLSADLQSVPKTPVRPSWAAHRSNGYLPSIAAAKILLQSSQWNAGIRPAPVRAPVPKPHERGKKDFTRMNSRSPSPPLFEPQPWHIAPSNQGSDTD